MTVAKINIFLVLLLIWVNIYGMYSPKFTQVTTPLNKPKTKSKIEILHAQTLYGYKTNCPITNSSSLNSQCNIEAFSGNVHMRQKNNNLKADSVVVNRTLKTVQAYGNIHFWDDSLEVFSEYLNYDSKAKTILFQNSVHVIRGKQELFSEELLYNRSLNTIDYYTGGHIINDSNMHIYSKKGTYYTKAKTLQLKYQVLVVDSNFQLSSDSLLYFQDKHKIKFIAPTQIQQDSSLIYTHNGHYNTDSGTLYMIEKPVMVNKATIYTADTINYNKLNGFGIASRNFSFYDSVQNISINSHKAYFNTKTKYFKATKHPFMIHVQRPKKQIAKSSDSLFIRADTIISFLSNSQQLDSIRNSKIKAHKINDSLSNAKLSAQNEILKANIKSRVKNRRNKNVSINNSFTLPKTKDSTLIPNNKFKNQIVINETKIREQKLDTNNIHIPNTKKIILPLKTIKEKSKNLTNKLSSKPRVKEVDISLNNDSLKAVEKDSSNLNIDSNKDFRIVIAYNHVFIFRDSIQAIADSILYISRDSILSSYGNPVIWNANKVQFSADTVNYLFSKNRLKLIEGHGKSFTTRYNQKNYFDQVSSINIKIFIDSNKVKQSLSIDSVNSITYLPDEKNNAKILSVNVVKSDSLLAYYGKNKPEKVLYLRNVRGVSYPLKDLPANERYLPQFNWQLDSTYRPKSKFDIIDTLIFSDLHLLSEQDLQHYARKNTRNNPKKNTLFGKFNDSTFIRGTRDSQHIFKPQKEIY